jgi:[protein-PII] uridylyltransferase
MSRSSAIRFDAPPAEGGKPLHLGGAGDDIQIVDFLATMPERYRREFEPAAVRQHARIAAARGARPAHAGRFVSGPGAGLCVVAPDAPGLLAAISAALMLEGFDITRADAYTRRASEQSYEAVDLFWVRRMSSERSLPLSEEDALAVRNALLELLREGGVGRSPLRSLAGISPGTAETRVRFSEPAGVPWLTLELESNDRPGLLSVVASTLYAEGVQIVGSRIRTHGLRVHDSFDLLEGDGSPIAGTRLQRIQLAVLTAVDDPPRLR